MEIVVHRPVEPLYVAAQFEAVKQLGERAPAFAGERRHAPQEYLLGRAGEPARKVRLGLVADGATVVKEFDDLDALAGGHRSRRIELRVLLAGPELRPGHAGREQQCAKACGNKTTWCASCWRLSPHAGPDPRAALKKH